MKQRRSTPARPTTPTHRFNPSGEWVLLIRELAVTDRAAGGSGRYGVYWHGSYYYFERWQPLRAYVWEHQTPILTNPPFQSQKPTKPKRSNPTKKRPCN